MARFIRKYYPAGSLGCFFCGVDSKPLLIFFIGMIGSLALATIFTGLGWYLKGGFKNSENIKNEVFEAENRV